MSQIQYMVCEGSPFVGFTFHGPFATDIQAESWAMARPNDGFWWIHKVERPTLGSDKITVHCADWVDACDLCNRMNLEHDDVMDALEDAGVTWGGCGGETTFVTVKMICRLMNVACPDFVSQDTFVYFG